MLCMSSTLSPRCKRGNTEMNMSIDEDMVV